MIVTCTYCDSTGPFAKLIEVAQAIEIEFELDEEGRIIDRIPEDAVCQEEDTALVGYRCENCKRIMTRVFSGETSYSLA